MSNLQVKVKETVRDYEQEIEGGAHSVRFLPGLSVQFVAREAKEPIHIERAPLVKRRKVSKK